ncbi:tRNA (guanine(37)-N1)-methyltransferase-like [Octopus sinensis]|uniref:tRNA (Guanine(37)-N1)-methyltransferase-like n=1 Tax=Octopus sinensis TaxID=2607531 RepID=A0A6P7U3B1_9MOLL|nr:tRNA (guanine(37)-N1)-methyltransferase-like [Octopus sinensis]
MPTIRMILEKSCVGKFWFTIGGEIEYEQSLEEAAMSKLPEETGHKVDEVTSELVLNGPGTVLYDVFSGIGPFSIPAAVCGTSVVLANDLNPDCYYWLNENIRINRKARNISTYNMDAINFIQEILGSSLEKVWLDFIRGESFRRVLVLMNLPASAIEFLPCFIGICSVGMKKTYIEASECARNLNLSMRDLIPVVYCYCFAQKCADDSDAIREITDAIHEKFGGRGIDILAIRRIRDVSPSKLMFCCEIHLTYSVLFDDTVI